MPTLSYNGDTYDCMSGESVLDALLRHQIDIPYSCKAGVCNTCIMLCKEKELPCNATNGLKDTLVDQGYFLACQCVPTAPLEVHKAEDFGLFGRATVMEKERLSQDVCRVRLCPATDLYYRAGQYINLRTPTGGIRSYSLASLPAEDDFLELHIKRMPKGLVSNWIFDELQQGKGLDIQGPFGDCFYLPGDLSSDIMMIGTGTGLAPLIGILRDALHTDHQGQIRLYHGDYDPTGLYLDNYLHDLASKHDNFHYTPCLSTMVDHGSDDIFQGFATDCAFSENKKLKGMKIYLCGSPKMVKTARKMAYMSGADLKNIYADPFITKDLRQNNATTSDERTAVKEARLGAKQ